MLIRENLLNRVGKQPKVLKGVETLKSNHCCCYQPSYYNNLNNFKQTRTDYKLIAELLTVLTIHPLTIIIAEHEAIA